MQPHGSETSLQMVLSHRGSSIRVQLSNCSPRTLQALRKFTFLRVLEDGHSLPVLQDGPTIVPFGPDPVPASRSASPAKARGKRTSVTSGRNSTASSQPAAPTSLWENRLRQRLASLGSTECVLTWKASVTPAGRPLSRLVPSTRPTAEIDCGLWPTARTMDATSVAELPCQNLDRQRSSPSHDGLARTATHWYPPNASWPTPTSRDWKDGPPCENVETNGLLGRMVWPTPRAAMTGDAHPNRLNDKNLNLETAVSKALWSTIRASDGAKGGPNQSFGAGGTPLPAQASGTQVNSPSAQTEKPGALNPEFVSWLMGFPPEWVNCAPSAMPSSRKSRPKSSAPISTARLISPPPY